MAKRVYVSYTLLDSWLVDDETSWEEVYSEAIQKAQDKGFYDYVNDCEVEVFDAQSRRDTVSLISAYG